MRILIYGLNYAPEPTGTGKYTGEMAEWLSSQGHSVEVICGLPHYPRWRLHEEYQYGRSRVETSESGVRVYRASHFVPSPNNLGAKSRIKLETSFTFSAARYWIPLLFSRIKPDVVIAVMPPMQVGLWPMLFRWFRRVPWVLHVQDLQVDAALRLGMLHGGFAKLLYWIESFLLKSATRVSSITETMLARIRSKGVAEESCWLFPNWSDINTIRPMSRMNYFRQELGATEDDVVVMYSGNMGEKQGLDLVLDAASLCASEQRIRFVLVGEGGAKARLEDKTRSMGLNNVIFLPIQPWARVPEMLAAADVHLVVQKPEAADLVMPSKLTNILAAGRPCIATAEPGTALYDVVSGHTAGLAVPPLDSSALSSAISQLVNDAELRNELGRNARDFAESNLDRERVLNAFQQQLQTITVEASQ